MIRTSAEWFSWGGPCRIAASGYAHRRGLSCGRPAAWGPGGGRHLSDHGQAVRLDAETTGHNVRERSTGERRHAMAAPAGLRHAVIWRKLCIGTQSANGSRFVETMLTVIESCRQQHRDTLGYLRAAAEAHLADRPASSLLPEA